jgi:CheY-like chemotaxis protein
VNPVPAPRVLVVEDSPTQARLLRLILEADAFVVEVAVDGSAALARLGAAPFDVVVSDVLMPVVTGFDLCRTIKADPALSGIPVVLVTTLREPQEIVQALEVGADSFIRKPYEPEVLVTRLRSLLAQRDHATGSVAPTPRRRREDDSAFRVESVFNGKTIRVPSDCGQILNLLLGTFEDAVSANRLLLDREEELSLAKADLEEAARMKDIFFATLSHELRTPLTRSWAGCTSSRKGRPTPRWCGRRWRPSSATSRCRTRSSPISSTSPASSPASSTWSGRPSTSPRSSTRAWTRPDPRRPPTGSRSRSWLRPCPPRSAATPHACNR